MPRVENEPGSHQVLPQVAAATRDLPARARGDHPGRRGPGGDEQAPVPRDRNRSKALLRAAWVLAVVGLALGLAALRSSGGTTLLQQCLAASLGVVLAVGLSVRSGGQVLLATALAVLVAVSAVLTQWAAVLAGAAIGTAVLAACLAVLGTRPAPTFLHIVGEVVLATLVATAGGLGAAGFGVGVDDRRFSYTVLVTATVATVALVYRLAGGLHGLGRRGLLVCAAALVLLVVVVVYTAALTTYGSSDLVQRVASAQQWTRDQLGGVPHPVEVLVGIPALVWGVSLRSRRRQGWWVCTFGAAATASSASRLVDHDMPALETALGSAYSVALGVLLGYAVIRLEHVVTGRRGPGAASYRREPARLQPLH